jgi:6-phospho-3-hexuloisomerase
MHMGVAAHMLGDAATPNCGAGDLLLVGSGSGSTASLVSNAARAKALGATVALVATRGWPAGSMACARGLCIFNIGAACHVAAAPAHTC